jgi:GT2 family glycosyltransferase
MIPVIIPAWINDEETLRLTENAINSISNKHTAFFIVDNGSTLGGGRMREWADVYIRLKTNLGYAKATNLGLKACFGANAVVVANNDIRVSPNWLEVAEEILQDKEIGSVHFRMLPYTSAFEFGNETWKEGKERWCSSSFFVMRPIQFYDDNFFNSCEDWDFWLRFRKAGWKTAYTNKACYCHLDSHTAKKLVDREKNDKINREYFKSKYGEYPEVLFKKEYPEQMKQDWKPMP